MDFELKQLKKMEKQYDLLYKEAAESIPLAVDDEKTIKFEKLSVKEEEMILENKKLLKKITEIQEKIEKGIISKNKTTND